MKPLIPESDQYLISPYSNTAESFIKIMRIKETITTKEALIVKQILLVSTRRNLKSRVWRMWIVMLGCQGLNVL